MICQTIGRHEAEKTARNPKKGLVGEVRAKWLKYNK